MVFEAILNPIFSPLLSLDPLVGIALISFIISLLITIVYKLVTDQDLMKRLKTELKELQKEMKDLKDQPAKAMAVQKRAMETNMKYMMQSFKPTLFTMLPIIIIFGWLNMHMAYYPLMPGQEFTATLTFEDTFSGDVSIEASDDLTVIGEIVKEVEESVVVFTMKGPSGEYLLDFVSDGETLLDEPKEVIISDERDYAKVEEVYKGDLKKIELSNEPIKPFGPLSIFGWRPGWLGAYILFSILFSTLLRKIMKVY